MNKEDKKAIAAGFMKANIQTCMCELGLSRKEMLAACVNVLEEDDTFNKNYVVLRRRPKEVKE